MIIGSACESGDFCFEILCEAGHDELLSVKLTKLVLDSDDLATSSCAGPVPFCLFGLFESCSELSSSLCEPGVPLLAGVDGRCVHRVITYRLLM